MVAVDAEANDVRRPDPLPLPITGLVAVLAVLGGAFTGVVAVFTSGLSPALPVAAALGALAAPLILTRPRVALVVVVASEVGGIDSVSAAVGIPGAPTAILVLATGSCVLAVRRGAARFTWSPIYLALLVFVAVRAITVLLAPDPGRAITHIGDVARAIVFLLVVSILASVERGPRTIVFTMAGAMAFISGLAILQEFVVGNEFEFFGLSKVPKQADLGATTARHAGPMKDANFWGRSLALAFPLALSMWAVSRDVRNRLLWMAAGLLVAAGIYLTGSRGAIITLAVSTVAWMALASPRSRRFLLVTPTIALLVMMLPGVGSRLSTLSEISDASEGGGDASLVVRVAVQRQGFEMFLDHPTTGVGAANFPEVGSAYLRESGLVERREIAPHNIYLEMAAESGIPGLASWLLLYGIACWLAIRALLLRLDVRDGDLLIDRYLPVGVFAALVGWAFASIFLHLAGLRTLLVVVALAAALDARARRLATSARWLPPLPQTRVSIGRTAMLVAASIVLFVIVAAALGARTMTWRATADMVVTAEGDDVDGHDHSVAQRRVVKKTAAAIVGSRTVRDEVASQLGIPSDAIRITARAAAPTATVAVTAEAAEPAIAAEAAEAARAAGTDLATVLGEPFVLRATDAPIEARHVAVHDVRKLSYAGFAALSVGWAAALGRWLRRTRDRGLAPVGG